MKNNDDHYIAGYKKLAVRVQRIKIRYAAFFIVLLASHACFLFRPEPPILFIHVILTLSLMVVMVQQFRHLDETREKIWLYGNFLSANEKNLEGVTIKNPATPDQAYWLMWATQFAPLGSLLLILKAI